LVEAQTDEFVLQPLVDFAYVVAYQTKTNCARVVLQEITKGLLGIFGHVVDFVQYDKLHSSLEQRFRVHKKTDLIANNVDSSLVGRIQVDDKVLVLFTQFGLIRIYDVDHRCGFTGSRWTIEQ